MRSRYGTWFITSILVTRIWGILLWTILLWGIMYGVPQTLAADIPQASLSITGTGCFVRLNNMSKQTYTVRMQTPECSLAFFNSGATVQTVTINIENIDPDFVTVDAYDAATGLIKTDNTVQFAYTADPGESIVRIEPWYTYGDDFYFGALADNQARGTIDINPVFEEMIPQLNMVNPAFYTNSGDVVQGSRNTGTMQLMFEALLQGLAKSTVPMYTTAGNHDYDIGLDTYQAYLGDTDYSFDFGSAHFTFLSTIVSRLYGAVSTEQLDWLTDDLATTDKTQVMVFFHHPVSAPTWGKTNLYFTDESFSRAIAKILDERQIDIAINGHAHGYDNRLLSDQDVTTIENGFEQLITGGAGGNLGQPQGRHHFLIVHVSPEGITHTPVYLDEFNTVVEYTGNNGKQRVVTAEVTNEADQDLPYIRLKFKLNTPFEDVVISDQDGNYYTNYYSHAYDDYTVVYLEIPVSANSSTVYTVQSSTILHEMITNTVAASGQVTWVDTPASANTSVPDLQVIPNQLQTQITDLNYSNQAGRIQYTWVELPAESDIVTSYTLDNLLPQRQYQVVVNDQVYDRFVASADGQITFQYADTEVDVDSNINAERNFQVTQIDPMYPTNVLSVPFQGGTPHVRLFRPNSDPLASWFSFSNTNTGSFQAHRARIDDRTTDRILMSTADDSTPRLGIYSLDGSEWTTLEPFTDQATSNGLTIATGDLTGNNRDEIAVTSNNGDGTVNIYRYVNKKNNMRQMVSKRLFGKTYSGSPTLRIANITSDPAAELITLDQTGNSTKLQVFGLNARRKLKKLGSVHIPISFSHAAMTVGYFSGQTIPEIAVYAQQTNTQTNAQTNTQTGHIYVYRYQSTGPRTGKLKQRGHTVVQGTWRGTPQLVAARLTSHPKDQLVLASTESNRIVGYTFNAQYRAKRLLNKYPFGKTYTGGIYLGLVNQNEDATAELVTTQLTGDSFVADWTYNRATGRLQQIARWQPYGTGFTGGVHVLAP